MKPHQVEHIEVELLLEAIFQRYGYDFRSYARASIERRVRGFVSNKSLDHISDLIPACIHDAELFSQLAQQFSVSVTEMFRDPSVYRCLREQVLPMLETFPHVKVWHAGCASGEEVYSLAILLHEAGLLERSTLFGTDFNDAVLARARQGIYPADRMQQATRNYQAAGGQRSFSEYYHAGYDAARMEPGLKARITFANHNLAADRVFGEMQLVFCRNVLIYFDRGLQDRALSLFTDSLVRGGYLCLGAKEDIQFSCVADAYETVDRDARIFRKKVR